jgi:hypothetical protein
VLLSSLIASNASPVGSMPTWSSASPPERLHRRLDREEPIRVARGDHLAVGMDHGDPEQVGVGLGELGDAVVHRASSARQDGGAEGIEGRHASQPDSPYCFETAANQSA